MIDRYFGDRSGYRRTTYNRTNRFNQTRREDTEEPKAVYTCIDEAVDGSRPRIEFGIGDYDAVKETGSQYETGSPFVKLRFYDDDNERYCFVKVYVKDHEYLTKDLLDQINRIKCGLLDYMRKQNPEGNIKGKITVHGSDDNLILEMLKKRIRAEEIIGYQQ